MNVMSVLKKFIPFLKNSEGILIHFCSCLENLLDLDLGKELFKEEKIALKLYEKLDGEFILSLDDYVEDFFNVLSLINDIPMSKYYLFQTEFLVKLIQVLEMNANNLDLSRHLSLFIVSLLVKGILINDLFKKKKF